MISFLVLSDQLNAICILVRKLYKCSGILHGLSWEYTRVFGPVISNSLCCCSMNEVMASMSLIGVLPLTANRTGISGKLSIWWRKNFFCLGSQPIQIEVHWAYLQLEFYLVPGLSLVNSPILLAWPVRKEQNITTLKLQGTRVFCTVFSLHMFILHSVPQYFIL